MIKFNYVFMPPSDVVTNGPMLSLVPTTEHEIKVSIKKKITIDWLKWSVILLGAATILLCVLAAVMYHQNKVNSIEMESKYKLTSIIQNAQEQQLKPITPGNKIRTLADIPALPVVNGNEVSSATREVVTVKVKPKENESLVKKDNSKEENKSGLFIPIKEKKRPQISTPASVSTVAASAPEAKKIDTTSPQKLF